MTGNYKKSGHAMLVFTYLNPSCVIMVRTQPIREKIDPIMEMTLKALSAAGGRFELPSTLAVISYRKSRDVV